MGTGLRVCIECNEEHAKSSMWSCSRCFDGKDKVCQGCWDASYDPDPIDERRFRRFCAEIDDDLVCKDCVQEALYGANTDVYVAQPQEEDNMIEYESCMNEIVIEIEKSPSKPYVRIRVFNECMPPLMDSEIRNLLSGCDQVSKIRGNQAKTGHGDVWTAKYTPKDDEPTFEQMLDGALDDKLGIGKIIFDLIYAVNDSCQCGILRTGRLRTGKPYWGCPKWDFNTQSGGCGAFYH